MSSYKITKPVLALRISTNIDLDVYRIIDFLNKDSAESILLVRELGTREHYHTYIETDTKIATMRARLRRDLPSLIGNKQYSLTKVKQPFNYLLYCCKGEDKNTLPSVTYLKGIDTEQIRSFHYVYWENHKLIETTKIKKRLHKSIGVKIHEYIMEVQPETREPHCIMSHILDYYHNHNKTIPNKYQLQSLTRTLEFKLGNYFHLRERYIDNCMDAYN